MLKTNSKQAITNIRAYIMESWNIEPEEQGRTWEETKQAIQKAFEIEKYSSAYERQQTRQQAFTDWLQGLPRALGDYMLNTAIMILGSILEETPEEANRYSQSQAEDKMNYLIYREVYR